MNQSRCQVRKHTNRKNNSLSTYAIQKLKSAPDFYKKSLNAFMALHIFKRHSAPLQPGRDYIARLIGSCVKTISRHTNSMQTDGLLVKFQRSQHHPDGSYTGQSNIYVLNNDLFNKETIRSFDLHKKYPALLGIFLSSERSIWSSGVPPYYNLLTEEDINRFSGTPRTLSVEDFGALLAEDRKPKALRALFFNKKRGTGGCRRCPECVHSVS